MKRRMRQCTATAEVTFPELLIAILAGQKRVTGEDCEDTSDTARCELGLWHGDEHAAFVWDWREHKPQEGLWARWTPDGTMRFESLRHCEISDDSGDDEACMLYRRHPGEHSWALRDPETEALRRRVLAEGAGVIELLSSKPN